MSNNPINLALRFFLEIAALVAMGYWGWTQHTGFWRVILVIGVPLIAAAVWGVFRIPNDPKEAPIEVAGWVRLLIEAAFFGGGVWLLMLSQRSTTALVFAVVIVLHYATSYDRVWRMLKGA